MDAARELAQLLERQARAPPARRPCSFSAASGSLRSLAWARRMRQREGDEPLLGAVVQVALEPAALRRAGLDEPGARRPQLLDARAQLRLQALVLDREAGRGGDGAHELGVVAQRAVVHDRAHERARRARPASRRAAGSSSLGQRDRVAAGVDPALLVLEPVDDLQRAVAQRVGQQLAQARPVLAAHPLQQVGDGAAAARRASAASPNRKPYGVSGEGDDAEQHQRRCRRRRDRRPPRSVSEPASSTSSAMPDHRIGAIARRCGCVARCQRPTRT